MIPKFYKWDGGSLPDKWSFGYLTGKDNDMVCVKSNYLEKDEDLYLSPVCKNVLTAFIGFILARTCNHK